MASFDSDRRRVFFGSMVAFFVARFVQASDFRIEGIEVESTSICEGQRLVLNGAGVRKRGYFKANVVALYLPEKLTLAESVYRLNGMRRLQLHVLRDFTSSTISRMLIADFQRVATDAEFKQLIPEVAEIGRMYVSVWPSHLAPRG